MNEVFTLFGGKDTGLLNDLLGKIDDIASRDLDNGESYKAFREMLQKNSTDYEYGRWTPEEKNYDPGGNTFFFQDQLLDGQTIGEDRMQALINKLIENIGKNCSERN